MVLPSQSNFEVASVLLTQPRSLFGYDVIDRIGDGAGSTVYAVSDPLTKQIFALKHVVRKTEKDIRFIEQLENEYNVGRLVSHPSLRRVVAFKANRTMLRKVIDAALVVELFDGHSLEARLPRKIAAIVDCFVIAAGAIAALHDAGFVHCDLKPNNIMIGSEGQVKVIDLGQACSVGTVKTRIQGTPDFIAPEQVHCKAVGKSTDVFNFGATLYWALTQQKLQTLFTLKKGENSFLLDNAIAAPVVLNPGVPQTLSNLVMECVLTNPTKRPADMKELSRRLEVIQYVMNRGKPTPTRLN